MTRAAQVRLRIPSLIKAYFMACQHVRVVDWIDLDRVARALRRRDYECDETLRFAAYRCSVKGLDPCRRTRPAGSSASSIPRANSGRNRRDRLGLHGNIPQRGEPGRDDESIREPA